MERLLLVIIALGYFLLQMFWFFMDSRSMKEKVRFYVLLQGNFSLRIVAIGLAVFVLMKFISPEWLFSIQVNSILLRGILSFGGLLLYLTGLIICVWARLTMGSVWTPAEETSIRHKKELITQGPFSFTRNPIYLGLIMIYLGFFIALKSYLVIVVLFIGWFFYKKSIEEERILEEDFGSDYLKYKSKVRRFI